MGIDRRRLLVGLLGCPLCASAARAAGGAHWSYEGAGAPDKWGKLDKNFQACAVGAEQSPVNLAGGLQAQIQPLNFDWKAEAYKVSNNGHTIQADVSQPGGTTLDGTVYALKQFHFHTPSEHAIDGKRSEMEVHLVHADGKGKLAVIGVFVVAGAGHAGFAAVMAAAPSKEGSQVLPAAIDATTFLPWDRARYRYEGSLTTPPCSEVVDWNVYAQPLEVAKADIDRFKQFFPHNNARPLQPLRRRFLLRS